jgi:hypothetical protein
MGAVPVVAGQSFSFPGACFANNTATAEYTLYGVRVTLVSSNQVRGERREREKR